MKVVVDTNVLVSGLLTPLGPCGEIVRFLSMGHFQWCIDERILAEYDEVLHRRRFGIAAGDIHALLQLAERDGEFVQASALPYPLPDEKDNSFLEVALAARADYLVTGNLRHFPDALRGGMRVLSPREFLEFLRSGNASRADTQIR